MALPTSPELFPPVAGPDFVRAPEVERVAGEVLERHGRPKGIARLHAVRMAVEGGDVRIAYYLNLKPYDPLKDDATHDAIAKCMKAPPLWHAETGLDFAIWVRAFFWNTFEDRGRQGTLLHELLHIDIRRDPKTDELKLKVREHDVEEFVQVVRYYGAFLGGRAEIARAYELYQTDGGTPPDDDPNVVAMRQPRGRPS